MALFSVKQILLQICAILQKYFPLSRANQFIHNFCDKNSVKLYQNSKFLSSISPKSSWYSEQAGHIFYMQTSYILDFKSLGKFLLLQKKFFSVVEEKFSFNNNKNKSSYSLLLRQKFCEITILSMLVIFCLLFLPKSIQSKQNQVKFLKACFLPFGSDNIC